LNEIISRLPKEIFENDSTLLNIAVGVAIAFEEDVIALANQYYETEIENPSLIETYDYIANRYLTGSYEFDVASLTAWHFRYIAGSWSTTTELDWVKNSGFSISDKNNKTLFLENIGSNKYINYTLEVIYFIF